MTEEGKGNSGAFPSEEIEERHSPGDAGAAKRALSQMRPT
jgi:hypothetical protein